MDRCLILDCDGVLVDSEKIGHALLRDDLAACGLSMTIRQVHDTFVGMTMTNVAVQAATLGAVLPRAWVTAHYARLYARLAEGTPLVPGVAALLDRLDAAGVPYAVASNGTTEKMTTTLSQHPAVWERVRDRLFSGQEIGAPKPDPGLYLHAARALGVPPAQCVVVEDSATGCRAGVAAGMRTLGYAAGDDGAVLAREGAEVFRAMRDLPELLRLSR